MTGVMARPPALKPTVLKPSDALGEAGKAISARPLPAIAISFSALLAVAWFVAALGLVSTASGQVTSAFAARLATTIRIIAPASRLPDPPFPYPSDVSGRLDALPGVRAAGAWWPVSIDGHPVAVTTGPVTTGPVTGRTPAGTGPAVIAAAPGFLAAAGVRVTEGRAFGAWDQAHAAGSCLLGSELARALGIASTSRQHLIYLDNMACTVTGIAGSAPGQPEVLRSVVLPASTAVALFGPPDELAGAAPELLILVRPGAAAVVARLAPYVISQARPRRFSVSFAAGPVRLGRQVTGTLSDLLVLARWAGAAMGLIGLSGFSFFSVTQRIPELALRRALGARRRHLAVHVLAESALLGLLGGLAGASLGVAVVVLAARQVNWTPVIVPAMLWPAPLAAAIAGIVAGIIPALRAAWVRPSRVLSEFAPL